MFGKDAATKLLPCKRDVGGMGWRLGRLLTKIHEDRYGPKVRESCWPIRKIILESVVLCFLKAYYHPNFMFMPMTHLLLVFVCRYHQFNLTLYYSLGWIVLCKGAWVRVLLRTATEDDLLEDRPEHPKQVMVVAANLISLSLVLQRSDTE